MRRIRAIKISVLVSVLVGIPRLATAKYLDSPWTLVCNPNAAANLPTYFNADVNTFRDKICAPLLQAGKDGPSSTDNVSCWGVAKLECWNKFGISNNGNVGYLSSGQGTSSIVWYNGQARDCDDTATTGVEAWYQMGGTCITFCNPIAAAPSISYPSVGQATVSWTSSNESPISGYIVRYRPSGSATWNDGPEVPYYESGPVTVTGLWSNTTYEWAIQSHCNGSIASALVYGQSTYDVKSDDSPITTATTPISGCQIAPGPMGGLRAALLLAVALFMLSLRRKRGGLPPAKQPR